MRDDIFFDGASRHYREILCSKCLIPDLYKAGMCKPCWTELHAKVAEAMAKDKLYVICKVGYEYNDEYYFRGEGGSYEKPVKAYRDKKKAAAECDRLNAKWVSSDEGTSVLEGQEEEPDEDLVGYEVVEIDGDVE